MHIIIYRVLERFGMENCFISIALIWKRINLVSYNVQEMI